MLPPDAEYSIYHDGNFQLREDPHKVIAELLNGADWAVHKHPCRNCLYDEADVLLKEKIGTAALVQAEIDSYHAEKFPINMGLWANGFIARRHNQATEKLNEAWWKLYSKGCERDQISFPVARQQGWAEVKTIDANVFSSPWVKFNWHAAWKAREDNPDFWAQRAETRQRLARLAAVTGSTGNVTYLEP
jgi:hypothetical protein